MPRLAGDSIRPSPVLPGTLDEFIRAVKDQGLEGLVAKRRDSRYEAGVRSGAWAKMRVNEGQEFVIGGYTIGGRTFDALVFGYYDGSQLLYAALAGIAHAALSRYGNADLPVREPAGSAKRTVGSGAHGGEDDGMPLVEAGTGRAVRIPGMDAGRSSSPFALRRAPGRQTGQRRKARSKARLARRLLRPNERDA